MWLGTQKWAQLACEDAGAGQAWELKSMELGETGMLNYCGFSSVKFWIWQEDKGGFGSQPHEKFAGWV